MELQIQGKLRNCKLGEEQRIRRKMCLQKLDLICSDLPAARASVPGSKIVVSRQPTPSCSSPVRKLLPTPITTTTTTQSKEPRRRHTNIARANTANPRHLFMRHINCAQRPAQPALRRCDRALHPRWLWWFDISDVVDGIVAVGCVDSCGLLAIASVELEIAVNVVVADRLHAEKGATSLSSLSSSG